MKIVYTGPGISGALSSLLYLGANASPPVDVNRSEIYRRHGWQLRLAPGSEPLHAFVTHAYSLYYFERVAEGLASLDGAALDGFRQDVDAFRNADGLVVVIDSQRPQFERNIGFIRRLELCLSDLGRDPNQIPTIYQLTNEISTTSFLPKNFETRSVRSVSNALNRLH